MIFISTNVSVTNKTSNSISIKAQSNYFNANQFKFYLHSVFDPVVGSGTSYNYINGGYYYYNYTFTGLSASTEYRLCVSVALNGEIVEMGYIDATTNGGKLSTPYYISSSKTSNSITINYSTVSGANRYDIQCSNGVIASPSSPTYTFSNLQPNTQYSFRCMCRDIYGNYSDSNWSGYTYITTDSARPAYFYWDINKVSGQQFNVTASEWNRLIQNVKDVHVYKLGSYNSSSYPMTTVSRGQPFYAQRFNEVRFAIGSLNSTGLNNKYKGDTIYASELNILKDKLNAIT